MSETNDDPRCPECGEPIGQTATYCMHCSADLTEEAEAADADGDGTWDVAEAASTLSEDVAGSASDADAAAPGEHREAAANTIEDAVSTGEDGQFLDPDGLLDNTLTVVVGIAGGVVVGIVGTTVLGAVTGSPWAIPFGVLAWLGSTAYLARRRTVQAAVSKGGYAVALVLLLVPVVALSPLAEIDGGGRGGLFVALLVFVAVPATVAAVVGWVASRFVPEGAGTERT